MLIGEIIKLVKRSHFGAETQSPRAGVGAMRRREELGQTLQTWPTCFYHQPKTSKSSNVRFGSKADIAECETNVRFTPERT